MCDSKKPDNLQCDVCRTINLANHAKQSKPNMQMYDKCAPAKRVECPRAIQLPIRPTCIKVLNKEEYNLCKSVHKPKVPKIPYQHGKLMWLTKAGILVGTVYFTYSQGIWGDQQDVTECVKRWQEYIRSINTRKPPVFDRYGNVVRKEPTESLFAPAYQIYKEIVTTCFAGVVKLPLIIKCTWLDYVKALEMKKIEEEKERRLHRRG